MMLKRNILGKESGTEHSAFVWKSDDDLDLYAQTWMPLGNIKGVINIVHGLGEHSGRYDAWAKKLGNAGFIVRSFDLRGHGRSEGKRGHASRYNRLLRDIEAFLKISSEEYPDLPQFLYGHSMGGNLVLNYVARNIIHLQGIIVTSPWLKLTHPPSKLLVLLVDLMSNIFPGFLVSNALKTEDLSRDLRVVHDYRNDELVHDRISLKLFQQIYYAGIDVSMNIYKINVPLLVMHGNGDNLTSCKATSEFVRNSSKKTSYIEWEGSYHELHHDLDKDKVFESLLSWLNRHIE